ncbi:MAG TPA: hypothetical protein VK458_08935, partial [Myxococcaceae bacterium]|nr:hypothetical protein [Myxococcaceae bacterium]
GTLLADASRTLLTQDSPTAMLEAEGLASETLRLSGKSLGTPRVHAPQATRVLWNGVDVPFHREGDSVVVGKTQQPLPSEPPPPPDSDEPQGERTNEPPRQEDSGSTLPPPFLPLAPPGDDTRPLGVSCSTTGGGPLALAFGVLALGGVLARWRRRRLSSRVSDASLHG